MSAYVRLFLRVGDRSADVALCPSLCLDEAASLFGLLGRGAIDLAIVCMEEGRGFSRWELRALNSGAEP